jgi:predicted phosphatase
MEQWLRVHGLEKQRINKISITSKKPPAVVYLDDRAILFTGKFPSPEEIKNFKTWQGF